MEDEHSHRINAWYHGFESHLSAVHSSVEKSCFLGFVLHCVVSQVHVHIYEHLYMHVHVVTVILVYIYMYQVEAVDVVQRLLEGRFSVWKRKKERRLEKRATAKEKRIKEWVSSIASGTHTCTCMLHVHVCCIMYMCVPRQ